MRPVGEELIGPMSLPSSLRQTLTDPQHRLAVFLGIASAPVTVALSWTAVTDATYAAGGNLSGVAFVAVGLITGYVYHDRTVDRRDVGIAAGVAASSGLLVVYVANLATSIDLSSPGFTALLLAVTPVLIVLAGAMSVIVVLVSTIIGDRIAAVRSWRAEAGTVSRTPRETDREGKTWKRPRLTYLGILPVTAVYVFALDSNSIIGGLLAVLLLVSTVVLAVLVIVGIYKDAERLHEQGEPWIPNVVAYVGFPAVAFVIVYSVATFNGWDAPAAIAQYAFLGVLWIAVVVYTYDRRQSIADSQQLSSH